MPHDTMMQRFTNEARAALGSSTSVEGLRTLLQQAAASGSSRADAQRVLEELRRDAPNEAAEDRILEVLDVVTDFCAPSLRIPWTT